MVMRRAAAAIALPPSARGDGAASDGDSLMAFLFYRMVVTEQQDWNTVRRLRDDGGRVAPYTWCIKELAFFDPSGIPIEINPGAVTSSPPLTVPGSAYNISAFFRSSGAEDFCSNKSGQGSILVRLASAQTLGSYVIRARGQARHDPSGWHIEASTDGVTWQSLDFQTGLTGKWKYDEQKRFKLTGLLRACPVGYSYSAWHVQTEDKREETYVKSIAECAETCTQTKECISFAYRKQWLPKEKEVRRSCNVSFVRLEAIQPEKQRRSWTTCYKPTTTRGGEHESWTRIFHSDINARRFVVQDMNTMEDLQSISMFASRVKISQKGNPDAYVVSKPDTYPIHDLRSGISIRPPDGLIRFPVESWDAAPFFLPRLQHSDKLVIASITSSKGNMSWLYHAQSNVKGLHWSGTMSRWEFTGEDVDLEMHIDVTYQVMENAAFCPSGADIASEAECLHAYTVLDRGFVLGGKLGLLARKVHVGTGAHLPTRCSVRSFSLVGGRFVEADVKAPHWSAANSRPDARGINGEFRMLCRRNLHTTPALPPGINASTYRVRHPHWQGIDAEGKNGVYVFQSDGTVSSHSNLLGRNTVTASGAWKLLEDCKLSISWSKNQDGTDTFVTTDHGRQYKHGDEYKLWGDPPAWFECTSMSAVKAATYQAHFPKWGARDAEGSNGMFVFKDDGTLIAHNVATKHEYACTWKFVKDCSLQIAWAQEAYGVQHFVTDDGGHKYFGNFRLWGTPADWFNCTSSSKLSSYRVNRPDWGDCDDEGKNGVYILKEDGFVTDTQGHAGSWVLLKNCELIVDWTESGGAVEIYVTPDHGHTFFNGVKMWGEPPAWLHCEILPAQETAAQEGFDLGHEDCENGWYDIQGQGVCNDFCRWTGMCGCEGACSLFDCALAGATVQKQYKSYSSFLGRRCIRQGSKSSEHAPWVAKKAKEASERAPDTSTTTTTLPIVTLLRDAASVGTAAGADDKKYAGDVKDVANLTANITANLTTHAPAKGSCTRVKLDSIIRATWLAVVVVATLGLPHPFA